MVKRCAFSPQPEAPARPVRDEGAGVRHRDGGRGRRGDVRDVPVELRFSAPHAGAYYERQRFADIFASLKRAPLSLRDRIASIPGVADVETRVVAMVTLDVAGGSTSRQARCSFRWQAERRPPVNDLFLRRGRWIDASRPDEVLAGEGFVTANRLAWGIACGAVINGRLRRLTVVGIALSPEHIYNIRPGEIVPDDRRFGTFWMERRALASAFDMEGGFNDVVLSARPARRCRCRHRLPGPAARTVRRARRHSARPPAVALDARKRAGSAADVRIHAAAHLLSVAAFILNVALTRALALQRAANRGAQGARLYETPRSPGTT